MLEFIVLMLVLVTMALTGFTVLAMLLVSGVFVLFGALAGKHRRRSQDDQPPGAIKKPLQAVARVRQQGG